MKARRGRQSAARTCLRVATTILRLMPAPPERTCGRCTDVGIGGGVTFDQAFLVACNRVVLPTCLLGRARLDAVSAAFRFMFVFPRLDQVCTATPISELTPCLIASEQSALNLYFVWLLTHKVFVQNCSVGVRICCDQIWS